MTSNQAPVAPRLKSAVLWGVVGALFFLVFHQWYLLLDGEFLGVGPVAAVAAGVFVATVVASYFTAGHLEVFERDEPPTPDIPEGEDAGSATTVEAGSTGSDATDAAGETVSAETAAATPSGEAVAEADDGAAADGSVGEESEEAAADEDEEAEEDPMDEWIWGGQDG